MELNLKYKKELEMQLVLLVKMVKIVNLKFWILMKIFIINNLITFNINKNKTIN